MRKIDYKIALKTENGSTIIKEGSVEITDAHAETSDSMIQFKLGGIKRRLIEDFIEISFSEER